MNRKHMLEKMTSKAEDLSIAYKRMVFELLEMRLEDIAIEQASGKYSPMRWIEYEAREREIKYLQSHYFFVKGKVIKE